MLSDFEQGPLIHGDWPQETWEMIGMQGRRLMARAGIPGLWP